MAALLHRKKRFPVLSAPVVVAAAFLLFRRESHHLLREFCTKDNMPALHEFLRASIRDGEEQ